MSDQWRVKIGSKAHGPFSVAAVQKLISSGKVTRETLISEGTSSEWIPAGSIVTFFPAIEAPEEWELEGDSEQPVLPQIMQKRNRRESSGNLANSGGMEPAAAGNMTIPQVLLDFKFRQYATPMLVRIAWVISIAVIVLAVLISTAMVFLSVTQEVFSSRFVSSSNIAAALIFLICFLSLTVFGAVILLLYNRVLCEIAIVAFDISDSLKSIDKKLSEPRE